MEVQILPSRLSVAIIFCGLMCLSATSLAQIQMEQSLVERAKGEPNSIHTFLRPTSAGDQSKVKPAGNALATSDQFVQLVRFPAEEQAFMKMNASTAYFRDFFAGGETFSNGANDGDTLTATVTFPSKNTLQFDPVTFHSSLNGQQDCWQSLDFTVCNSTSIDIIWFVTVQCGQTGDFSMSFSRNGVPFASNVVFHLTPTINPAKVAGEGPVYDQSTYDTVKYGNFCRYFDSKRKRNVIRECDPVNHPDETEMHIKQLGCYLTALSVMLQYQGVSTSPTTLNTWLTDNDGFDLSGGILPDKVLEYAAENNVKLSFDKTESPTGFDGSAAAGLPARSAVCAKGPTPLHVQHHDKKNNVRSHFVLAWGRDDQSPASQPETTFEIKDPNGGAARELQDTTIPHDYNNRYLGTREYQNQPHTFTLQHSVVITLYSPAELLLTNSAGQRTGINPLTNSAFSEIPNAVYSNESIEDPNDDSGDPANTDDKVLDIRAPADGTYTLTVTGTESGAYDLDFRAFDSNSQQTITSVTAVPVSPGSQQIYSFTTPIPTGAAFPLSGGFDGGGQRPRDVNHFLSYSNPTADHTSLPAGSTSFPVMIFYAREDITSSFTATLNGAGVSGIFHPVAGGFEVVTIPVQAGRNVLQLSIQGNLPNRIATDTDRLVFLVQ
jgi:hypothetical protein